MKTILFFLSFLFTLTVFSQIQMQEIQKIGEGEKFENIYSEKVYEDESVSQFVILIKTEVKTHKHVYHTEKIQVISGEGLMTVGDKTFKISAGNEFIIPKDTFHSLYVTSKQPIKVISSQMPKFNPEDRVFK